MLLSLAGDVTGVAGVGLAGRGVVDVADDAQGRDVTSRVQEGAVGIREKDHV